MSAALPSLLALPTAPPALGAAVVLKSAPTAAPTVSGFTSILAMHVALAASEKPVPALADVTQVTATAQAAAEGATGASTLDTGVTALVSTPAPVVAPAGQTNIPLKDPVARKSAPANEAPTAPAIRVAAKPAPRTAALSAAISALTTPIPIVVVPPAAPPIVTTRQDNVIASSNDVQTPVAAAPAPTAISVVPDAPALEASVPQPPATDANATAESATTRAAAVLPADTRGVIAAPATIDEATTATSAPAVGPNQPKMPLKVAADTYSAVSSSAAAPAPALTGIPALPKNASREAKNAAHAAPVQTPAVQTSTTVPNKTLSATVAAAGSLPAQAVPPVGKIRPVAPTIPVLVGTPEVVVAGPAMAPHTAAPVSHVSVSTTDATQTLAAPVAVPIAASVAIPSAQVARLTVAAPSAPVIVLAQATDVAPVAVPARPLAQSVTFAAASAAEQVAASPIRPAATIAQTVAAVPPANQDGDAIPGARMADVPLPSSQVIPPQTPSTADLAAPFSPRLVERATTTPEASSSSATTEIAAPATQPVSAKISTSPLQETWPTEAVAPVQAAGNGNVSAILKQKTLQPAPAVAPPSVQTLTTPSPAPSATRTAAPEKPATPEDADQVVAAIEAPVTALPVEPSLLATVDLEAPKTPQRGPVAVLPAIQAATVSPQVSAAPQTQLVPAQRGASVTLAPVDIPAPAPMLPAAPVMPVLPAHALAPAAGQDVAPKSQPVTHEAPQSSAAAAAPTPSGPVVQAATRMQAGNQDQLASAAQSSGGPGTISADKLTVAPAAPIAPAVIQSPAPAPATQAAGAQPAVPAQAPGSGRPAEKDSGLGSATAPDPSQSASAQPAAAAAPAQVAGPIAAAPPVAAHAAAAVVAPALLQVGHAVAGLHVAAGTQGQVTINLHPADLGAVQVKIERAPDGTAIVTVQVEKSETLQTMQQDISHLHQALDRAGVPAEQRQVTLHLGTPATGGGTGTGTEPGGGYQRGSQPQQQQARGGRATPQPALNTPNDAEAPRWLPTGINITA